MWFHHTALCKMRCMSYACKNQDITCIHIRINMPNIWFMSNACHMQAYFMRITCAGCVHVCRLYMHITEALKFDFSPILQHLNERLCVLVQICSESKEKQRDEKNASHGLNPGRRWHDTSSGVQGSSQGRHFSSLCFSLLSLHILQQIKV